MRKKIFLTLPRKFSYDKSVQRSDKTKKRFDYLHGRVKLFIFSRCSWRKAKEENRCKNDGKKLCFLFSKSFSIGIEKENSNQTKVKDV